MEHILFTATVLGASSVLALLEIEIEGDQGWASGLPTWRIENRWTRRVLGARAVTGYHVYFHLLLLLLAHLPFTLGLATFSWAAELRIASFIIFLWLVEDFLWFVFHPAWGLRSFRRDRIPWHAPNWWLFMPRDYWIFGPLAVAFYVLSWRG